MQRNQGERLSALARLTGFAIALAILFAAGLGAGSVLDPEPPASGAETGGHDEAMTMAGGEHGAAMPVRGLANSEDGLRLVVADSDLPLGRTENVSFRVVDDSGRAVRDFEVEHTKRMHMIVVRRDLTGFQHLHPRMRGDGTWTTRLTLPEAGSYRLYADFVRAGEPVTLATDLRVDGRADLRPVPTPSSTATADGYDISLAGGAASAGEETRLSFAVTKGGEPVDVEPYLGADGHLVVLRDGDLAFLHVHPSEHEDGAGGEHAVDFDATLPTAGRYRMFLQFQDGGRVHTAEFTTEAK